MSQNHINKEYNFAKNPGSITKLANQIRNGEASPLQLVKNYIKRISVSDSSVNAWVSVDTQGALETAEQLEKEASIGKIRGPLHGVPIGIKDIIDVAGWPTKCNSPTRSDIAPANADAEIVSILKSKGAIILGKCHTTEFAYFNPSPACNPHNINHTPGGSSSGPAAAVASGTVPGAIGTQTIASVNRPAAYCGIGAFKPSTGTGANYGVTPLAPMFDTVGFYGWSVADAVALFEATLPISLKKQAQKNDQSVRIVILEDTFFNQSNPEILSAREIIAKKLSSAGYDVVYLNSPISLEKLSQIQMLTAEFELSRIHANLLDVPTEQVSEKLREAISRGGNFTENDYLLARNQMDKARKSFFLDFNATDIFLIPTTPETAPEGLEWTGDPRFIAPWTALGGPIVSLPGGNDTSGMPIGFMLAGFPGDDIDFAKVSCQLEEKLINL